MQKHPKFGTMTMSNGIEIEAVEGAPVTAVYEGVVMFSEWFKGYGKSIILSHSGGVYTLYAHNSELSVQRGDQVQRGQVIARAGSTGSLTGPNLYFELREKDRPVNPRTWLRKMGVR
jgi:murein DD-endopeptidase MepM/ murein hydrolase activator NlpD